MTYTNFMTQFTGAKLHADRPFASKNFGKKGWDEAIKAGYNPSQVKTALQQLSQHGYGIGPGLRTERMQGVKGIAHGMSRFQGPGGNLGLTSYMQAKMAGYTPDQIKSGAESQGMFLPTRAAQQYSMDQRAIEERDQMLNYMKQLEAMMNRPQPKVGRSAPYAVGTGGAAGLAAADQDKKSRDKWKGTQKWRREAFAAAMNTQTGTGGAAATSGAGGSLNMAK